MNIFKEIITLLIEPVRFFGSRNFSGKIVGIFDRHKWLVYVLAFVIALTFVVIKYIVPYL
ncbi:hypothetical protein [Acholeplasma equifetale]|uniref:hypothetical protein n=1 Tax=Acholeplasma equifetale TaxID=264634 RepID=UPI00047A62EC|nr:hypothetical protein [Acholeplasma equifetale]